MLHSTIPQSERTRRTLAASRGDGGIADTFGFAASFIRRQYLLVFATAALAVGMAVAYLRVTPPTYIALAQVLLENPKSQYVKQDSPLAETVFDLTQIETQIQLIKSSAVAITVINKLNLADDPDFKARGFSFGSIWDEIQGWIWRTEPQPKQATSKTAEELIGAFLGRVDAHRVGYGSIIEISYSSSDPVRAATIANAVADAYIADQLNAKIVANASATTWLQDRLKTLADQAQAAEREVDAYRSKHNIVSSGGKPIDDQQIADLNARLVAARTHTSDTKALVNRFAAILKADWSKAPSVETMGAAGSDALNSPIINSLRTQYLELQRRENEWAARFGPNHLAVVDLRTRMQNIRSSIRDEILRLAETARNDYAVAVKREQAIESQLDATVSQSRNTDAAEVALREMETRAKGYRNLYETFQQRYVGAVQLESFPISDARVISPALPPDSKSKPKKALILGLGLFGGAALGLGLGLLREIMDEVFRTAAQVETILQLPCLSLVPLTRATRTSREAKGRQSGSDTRNRIASSRNAIDSEVIAVPLSGFVEAIRAIKLGIDLSPTKTDGMVIGITSALPNEGKTTIAASLARLIAHSGKRVIIVDCDLRNPALSNRFAPGAGIGHLEVATGVRSLEDAIWKDPKTDLAILPMVRYGPLFHTSEILASEATRALFKKLRAKYDYVIVDLPPLSPLIDARATGSFVDGFVLVIEWGRTKVGTIQHALQRAPNVYENVIGAVLNKTNMRELGRYDSHSGDFYSEKHYARYTVADQEAEGI